MKYFLFSIALFICCQANAQKLSQASVDTTCKVLAELTDAAIRDKEKDKIAVYYNTFQFIAAQYNVKSAYRTYFKEVAKNANLVGQFNIGLTHPPKKEDEFVNIDK